MIKNEFEISYLNNNFNESIKIRYLFLKKSKF